LYAMQ